MREIEHHHSHHTSRSKSRDRDHDKSYYTRNRRSKSRNRVSRAKKKRSKRRRHRRSSSDSKSSSQSRGSEKSSASVIHRPAQVHSCEENLPSGYTLKNANLFIGVPNKDTIAEIEDDSFTAKTFLKTAAYKKLQEKVVIDLKNDIIVVEGKVDHIQPGQSQLFHANFIGDDTRKIEKWIKKLFNYRQKAFQV